MPPRRLNLDPQGYYALLGLGPSASRQAVSAAYRGKARILHPDVPGTGSAAGFVALKQAYDIISDAARRLAYDSAAMRAAQAAEPRVVPPLHVFTARPAAGASPAHPSPNHPSPTSPPPTNPSPTSPSPTSSSPTSSSPTLGHRPRFTHLPLLVWLGLAAFLSLGVTEVVLHLRAEPTVVRAPIRPNAATVAPLSQSAHQAVLYGPAPAQLPGTPNFYVTPAASPAVLWRLDAEKNVLVPLGQLAPFSSVQALRLLRPTGLLEVVVSDGQTGFVQAAHVTPGNADAAHRAYCGYNAGVMPADGEVLEHRGSGSGRLEVDNRSMQPAVVKLRDQAGAVVVAVFLAPVGHADLAGLPAGIYRPDYAIGELWSRACGIFAAGMRARRMDGVLVVPRDEHLVVSEDPAGPRASDIADAAFERK